MSTDIDASPSPTSSLVSDVAFGLQATGNETAPHNLPATLTRFVGRHTESAHLHTLLTDARLISLVGPGGVGKTRLALQTAWHYVHLPVSPFPDGVCFVPLGSAYTEDDLIFTLAEALQIPYFSNINLKKHLTNLLRPREMLFVLDNFEQLTPHAYLLVEILQQAPHLRFLVTTRERLNVYGENAFPLTGLPLEATLETSPAAQLFVQNAKRVNPHFTLTPENRPHIAQICRDVDGLPLALEMASSWVRALSPAEIAQAVAHDLHFLEADWADVPLRQRNLQTTLEYSWNLLSPTEKEAFARLTVFEGSFDRHAALKVAEVPLPVLTSLGDKSFLNWNLQRGWFEIHPLLKRFAADRLAALPELETATRTAHSAHFMAYLQMRESALRGNTQSQTLREIGHTLPNIRVAWQWAVRQYDPALLETGLEALYQYYDARSLFPEGEQLMAQAMDALAPALADALVARVFYKLQARRAAFLFKLGRVPESQTLLENCLSYPPLLPEEKVFCQVKLGGIELFYGHIPEAQSTLQNALDLAQPLDQPWISAEIHYLLGRSAGQQGKYIQANEYFTTAYKRYKLMGDRHGEALCLQAIGLTLIDQGKYLEAIGSYEQALAIFRDLGDLYWEAILYDHLGYASRERGQYAQSYAYRQRSLEITRQIGDQMGEARALANLGNLSLSTGNIARALTEFEQALPLFRTAGRKIGEAITMMNLSALHLEQGHVEQAILLSQQAVDLTRALQDLVYEAYALMAHGRAFLALKNFRQAESAYQQAYALRQKMDQPNLALEALAGIAAAVFAQKRLSEAKIHAETVWQFIQAHGSDGLELWVHLACYRIFSAANDPRAGDVLRAGNQLLREQADAIPDEDLRRSFLENLADHRTLRAELARLEAPARPAGDAPLLEPLTRQETEILRLLAEGLSNQGIAERLVVSVGTVKFHVHNLYQKLGVSSRTQAIALAQKLGLV